MTHYFLQSYCQRRRHRGGGREGRRQLLCDRIAAFPQKLPILSWNKKVCRLLRFSPGFFFSFGKFVFCTCENHNSLRDFWSFRPPFGFFLCRFVPYVRKSMIYVEINDTENIYFTAFDNTCETVQ